MLIGCANMHTDQLEDKIKDNLYFSCEKTKDQLILQTSIQTLTYPIPSTELHCCLLTDINEPHYCTG